MENDDKRIALFKRVNGFTGPLSRTPWHWRTRVMAKLLATYMLLKNGGERKDSVAAIAEEWRRMFGLNRFWKIERIDADTAYCEIHFPCSLERTGDVQACYRLMEYDRALLERIGGQLVVLESRADPQVTGACKVAIRKRDDPRTELIAAHLVE
ncbi:MAG: hypothetical protein ACRERY_02495 [Pseudomonas sp.]